MLFNSYGFLFGFLPVTLGIFFGLARAGQRGLASGSLVVASLVFYAYWSLAYLPLLIGSILVNFGLGRLIASEGDTGRSRRLLQVGVAGNLLLLGYYKYTNFFLDTFARLAHQPWSPPAVFIPLGISFFTFTQIAFLVDTHQRKNEAPTFWSYSLFVTFFPHLIAGPILHHRDTIPQFRAPGHFHWCSENMARGLTLLAIGLAKKVLIADNLAPWVAPVFAHAGSVTCIEAWIGVIAYTLQLYFDFSGYSDMAVGLGWMLNIRLPINFNSPYQATSIIDFWRRWHISLSAFLRDYLYIPLGGNRRGEGRRLFNLSLTMLLGGLWHGANWTFVVWGGLHGSYLVINHLWRKQARRLPSLAGWSLTMLAVGLGWVFFRAGSLHDAFDLLRTLVGLKGWELPADYRAPMVANPFPGEFISPGNPWPPEPWRLLALPLLGLIVARCPNSTTLAERLQPRWGWGLAVGLGLTVALLNIAKISEFLYFQF